MRYTNYYEIQNIVIYNYMCIQILTKLAEWFYMCKIPSIKWYTKKKKKKTQIRVAENNEQRFRESTHTDKFIELFVRVISGLKTTEKKICVRQ